MDFNIRLGETFGLFLDLCKDPKLVFPPDSREYALAHCWLDRLVRYQCQTTHDRRIRNIYMSYLVANLNEGRLAGPFLKKPPSMPLENVDFNAIPEEGLDDEGEPVCDLPICQRSPRAECDGSPAQTGFGRSEGGQCDISVRRRRSVHFSPEVDRQQSSKNVSRVASTPAVTNRTPFTAENKTNSSVINADKCAKQRATVNTSDNKRRPVAMFNGIGLSQEDMRAVRDNIIDLLQAIWDELHSYKPPGTNKYLESELRRFYVFVKRYTDKSEALSRIKTQRTLRAFLLLHLQNDLTKLLHDKFSHDGEKKTRRYRDDANKSKDDGPPSDQGRRGSD